MQRGASARVDPERWSLRLDGDAVGRSVSVSIDDLRDLPRVEVDSWLECAGNGRRLYEYVGGHPRPVSARDTHWLSGAMGMARWGGVRLSDVLALASPTASLAWVSPAGLDLDNEDDEPVRMCLPAVKALDPDTVVAFEMNGAPLVVAHGAPARLVVPGWIGAYSVKWLDRLELSTAWVPSFRADTYYRLRDPDGTDRGPATAHPVKSTLALDWSAELPRRPFHDHRLCAIGSSAGQRRRVVGRRRAVASSRSRTARWALGVDSVFVHGRPHTRRSPDPNTGDRRERCGATDTMAYHPNTILWNAVTPHPVTVR